MFRTVKLPVAGRQRGRPVDSIFDPAPKRAQRSPSLYPLLLAPKNNFSILINPHALVAQKITNEVVFRRFHS